MPAIQGLRPFINLYTYVQPDPEQLLAMAMNMEILILYKLINKPGKHELYLGKLRVLQLT